MEETQKASSADSTSLTENLSIETEESDESEVERQNPKEKIHELLIQSAEKQNSIIHTAASHKRILPPKFQLGTKCKQIGFMPRLKEHVYADALRAPDGIYCNTCKRRIKGPYFRCRICVDVDICIHCYAVESASVLSLLAPTPPPRFSPPPSHDPTHPVVFVEQHKSNAHHQKNSRGSAVSHPELHSVTWTLFDDLALLNGILLFGFDNWSSISQYVGGGKTAQHCKFRYFCVHFATDIYGTPDPFDDGSFALTAFQAGTAELSHVSSIASGSQCFPFLSSSAQWLAPPRKSYKKQYPRLPSSATLPASPSAFTPFSPTPQPSLPYSIDQHDSASVSDITSRSLPDSVLSIGTHVQAVSEPNIILSSISRSEDQVLQLSSKSQETEKESVSSVPVPDVLPLNDDLKLFSNPLPSSSHQNESLSTPIKEEFSRSPRSPSQQPLICHSLVSPQLPQLSPSSDISVSISSPSCVTPSPPVHSAGLTPSSLPLSPSHPLSTPLPSTDPPLHHPSPFSPQLPRSNRRWPVDCALQSGVRHSPTFFNTKRLLPQEVALSDIGVDLSLLSQDSSGADLVTEAVKAYNTEVLAREEAKEERNTHKRRVLYCKEVQAARVKWYRQLCQFESRTKKKERNDASGKKEVEPERNAGKEEREDKDDKGESNGKERNIETKGRTTPSLSSTEPDSIHFDSLQRATDASQTLDQVPGYSPATSSAIQIPVPQPSSPHSPFLSPSPSPDMSPFETPLQPHLSLSHSPVQHPPSSASSLRCPHIPKGNRFLSTTNPSCQFFTGIASHDKRPRPSSARFHPSASPPPFFALLRKDAATRTNHLPGSSPTHLLPSSPQSLLHALPTSHPLALSLQPSLDLQDCGRDMEPGPEPQSAREALLSNALQHRSPALLRPDRPPSGLNSYSFCVAKGAEEQQPFAALLPLQQELNDKGECDNPSPTAAELLGPSPPGSVPPPSLEAPTFVLLPNSTPHTKSDSSLLPQSELDEHPNLSRLSFMFFRSPDIITMVEENSLIAVHPTLTLQQKQQQQQQNYTKAIVQWMKGLPLEWIQLLFPGHVFQTSEQSGSVEEDLRQLAMFLSPYSLSLFRHALWNENAEQLALTLDNWDLIRWQMMITRDNFEPISFVNAHQFSQHPSFWPMDKRQEMLIRKARRF